MLRILDAILASDTCTLEVTGVNLYTRLVGIYLQEDTSVLGIEAGSHLLVVALSVFISVQHIVVVESASIFDLMLCGVANKLIERARFIQEKLMEIPESDRNSDYVDQLQDEYEELTENTAVYEYMRVESVYVTMVQETLGTIVEDIDIDL